MATRAEILRRVHAIRRAGARQQIEIENAALAEVVRTAIEATNSVVRLLSRLDGEARALEVLQSIDVLLSQVTARQEAALLRASDSIMDVSLEMRIGTATAFGSMTPRRIAALAQQFNGSFRPELRSDAHNRWIVRIPAQSLAPESALRASLQKAVLEGKGSKQLAREFLDGSTFGKKFTTAGQILRRDVTIRNLPVIAEKVSPLVRAVRVMRTEIGRLDNVAGITFDESAGLTHFINLGVGDDRQSDECAEATEQDPMTLAEWAASEWGVAPRHPNCRCAMFGVPPEVDSNLSILALGEMGALNQELIQA